MAVAPGLVLILEHSLSRAFALRNRLDALRRRYSDRLDLTGTQVLLRALDLACSDVERLVVAQARRLQEDDSDDTQRLVQRTVTAATRALEIATTQPLETLNQTHGRDFDPYIAPITRLAREIAGQEAELIFQPIEGPTYGTASLDEPLEQLGSAISPELRDTLKGLPHLRIIYYPVNAEAETFMHLLIGHELGHIVLRQKREDGDAIGKFYFDQTLADYRTELFKEVVSRVKKKSPASAALAQDDLVDEYGRMRERSFKWFSEFACDLMAVHLVGPAFFFALSAFASPITGYLGETKTHPPLALRLRRLLRLVEVRVPRKWKALPKTWKDEQGRTRTEPRVACEGVFRRHRGTIPGVSLSLEARIAGAAADRLSKDIRSILGDARYPPRRFHEDLDLIWENIDEHIAPVERVNGRTRPRDRTNPEIEGNQEEWSAPLDWRSIVNVAMFYWLDENSSDALPRYRRPSLDRDALRLQFARRIRGAVELSEILRSAKDLRRGLLELDIQR